MSPLDHLITHFDTALRTVAGSVGATRRASPGQTHPGQGSNAVLSGRLMRVNHCGEVCAQALYHGQALTAKSHHVARAMKTAADEETDHLSWCEARIKELDSHVSYLNPLWYASSFAMGALTGLLGDKINLGFVAATEEEVCRHIDDHLQKMPADDERSRQILLQMREDEAAHATSALNAGGSHFPAPIKRVMRGISQLMTRTTYWI